MERRHPGQYPLDDKRIYDAYVAGRMSAALAVGVRSGLFDRLDEAARSEEEIASSLELDRRGLHSLLVALVAMGVVREVDGRYELPDDASQYLVRGKPGSLWGLIDMEVDHFLSPAALMTALRTGAPSVYGSDDPWEQHEADPEAARNFTAAMHSVSERPAAGLAEVVDLGEHRRVLDVGGGSGALSLALARAWPELECVVWDLATVCDLAREYAAAAGLGDRVTAQQGDMFGEPFPAGFDVVLLSQILHDWPPERGAQLLASARGALPSGGRVLVHEKLVDDDGSGPLANALVNLDMLVWTEGQQYGRSQLEAMLESAGFEDVESRATAGYWSVVSGRRA